MFNLFKKDSMKDANCCNVVIKEVEENKEESKNCCSAETEKEKL
ncbi:hypothetical protein [Virgibacillus sp. 6R]